MHLYAVTAKVYKGKFSTKVYKIPFEEKQKTYVAEGKCIAKDRINQIECMANSVEHIAYRAWTNDSTKIGSLIMEMIQKITLTLEEFHEMIHQGVGSVREYNGEFEIKDLIRE